MHCGPDADRAPSGQPAIGRTPIARAPVGRGPIDSAPSGRAPVDRTAIDCSSFDRAPVGSPPHVRASADRAPVNKAQATHLPTQLEAAVDSTRREDRCAEQHSRAEPAATAAEDDNDQDSEQSGVFDQSPAPEAHTNVMRAIPQQLYRSADAQQPVTSAAHDDHQVNTASATAASAAATTEPEPSQFQAASNYVQVAEGLTAGSTRGPMGRCTKAKGRSKPRALKPRAPWQGAKEPVQKGGAGTSKAVSRATGLPKGHSGTAAQPSAVSTAPTAHKLHHGRASQDCQPTSRRCSARAGRSGALSSAVVPLGVLTTSVPSAAMHMPVAAAISPRLAVKEGTAVPATAGFEPSPLTFMPAAASSRPAAGASPTAAAQSPKSFAARRPAAKAHFLSPRTAAQSPRSSQTQQPKAHSPSPRAAAATSRGFPTSPRAAARSSRSPPTHPPEVSRRPPFVSTIRSGIPEPSSACPLPLKSPRSPRPADPPPKRMGTDLSAVAQTQPVSTSTHAVLGDQSQLMLLLDTRRNAVPASLHINALAEADKFPSGGVQSGVEEGVQGSSRACQGVVRGSWEGNPEAAMRKMHATRGTAGSTSEKTAEHNHDSIEQQREMLHSSSQHQPPQEASQRQLGSKASGGSLETTHTHRQLGPRDSSQPPQHQSLLQLTVADKLSSDGKFSSESEDEGASSISSMSNGPYGQSGVGVGVRKAGTSAWNQFPLQPDSVGSIAQLFMMRMRAKAVLQVCADCIADTAAP